MRKKIFILLDNSSFSLFLRVYKHKSSDEMVERDRRGKLHYCDWWTELSFRLQTGEDTVCAGNRVSVCGVLWGNVLWSRSPRHQAIIDSLLHSLIKPHLVSFGVNLDAMPHLLSSQTYIQLKLNGSTSPSVAQIVGVKRNVSSPSFIVLLAVKLEFPA